MVLYSLSPFMQWVRKYFLCSHTTYDERPAPFGYIIRRCLTCGKEWRVHYNDKDKT